MLGEGDVAVAGVGLIHALDGQEAVITAVAAHEGIHKGMNLYPAGGILLHGTAGRAHAHRRHGILAAAVFRRVVHAAVLKEHRHDADAMLGRQSNHLLKAGEEFLAGLLPVFVADKHPQGVDASALGVAEVPVDLRGIKLRPGLPGVVGARGEIDRAAHLGEVGSIQHGFVILS